MVEQRALHGLRVAVTRPEDGGGMLPALLTAAGAVPLMLPLVAIQPPLDDAPLRRAAGLVHSYDWIVFTSANAARALHAVLSGAAPGAVQPVRLRAGARVAAVGPATAGAVTDLLGWRVDAVPERHVGDAVVRAMLSIEPLSGRRVLWPRAEAARQALQRDLRDAGAAVDAPVAYRTLPEPAVGRRLALLMERRAVDVVVLTSPSAARCLAEAQPAVAGVIFGVIGPSTAEVARECGLPVHVEPAQHTIPALVDALRRHVEQT